MHTRRTLLLNKETWDLELDGVGRIALTGDDYATAQNVANEARLFTNDAYFNQDRGTPYFVTTLGQRTNPAVLRAYLRRAALLVEDVKEVQAISIASVDAKTRTVKGDIQFTTKGSASDVTVRTDF